MKTLHHGSLFLLFIFAASVLTAAPVHATGGGGFEIPEISEDFNEVKERQIPFEVPTQMNETKQEKGFLNRAGDMVSSAWNKLKNSVTKTWDSAISATKGVVHEVRDWAQSTAGKMAGGIALGVTALTGLFGKFGQQVKNRARSAYGGLRQRMQNKLYPNGTLKDRKVTDRELALAADWVYEGGISKQKAEEIMGKDWTTDPVLTEELPNGLQANVFVNRNSKEMIIALRETKTKGEPDEGPVAVEEDTVNAHVIAVRKYLQEKIFREEKYQDYNKILTGHSLGGYIAADCAARYKIPAVTFNVSGFPTVNGNALLGALGGSKGAVGLTSPGSYAIRITDDPRTQAEVIKESAGVYDQLIRNYRFTEGVMDSLGDRLKEKDTPISELFRKNQGNLAPR